MVVRATEVPIRPCRCGLSVSQTGLGTPGDGEFTAHPPGWRSGTHSRVMAEDVIGRIYGLHVRCPRWLDVTFPGSSNLALEIRERMMQYCWDRRHVLRCCELAGAVQEFAMTASDGEQSISHRISGHYTLDENNTPLTDKAFNK